MSGPSDYKKGPEGDEFKILGLFFVSVCRYSVSLDNGSTDVSLWC